MRKIIGSETIKAFLEQEHILTEKVIKSWTSMDIQSECGQVD